MLFCYFRYANIQTIFELEKLFEYFLSVSMLKNVNRNSLFLKRPQES